MSEESGPKEVGERPPSEPQTVLAQNPGAPAGHPAAASIPSPQGHNPPVLTAQASAPPAPVSAAGPMRNRRTGTSTGIGPAAGVFAAAAIRPPAAPRPQAAKGPLPSLRLDPSAHLLVALSSANQLPDGSFEFRGTLLLPAAHTGPVPLDRGAEVVGAGRTRDGQTSLAVMEFVVNGGHYILKEGNGAMKAQTPGAGGAVRFERSQLLEMWPMFPLIYEKAPDATAQPRPQQ